MEKISQKKTKKPWNNFRFYHTYSISEKMFSCFEKEMEKRHLNDERLLARWDKIVGEKYAINLTPNKIYFTGLDNKKKAKKVILCSTRNKAFATEIIFFKKDILSKLNTYFGTEKSYFDDLKISVISD